MGLNWAEHSEEIEAPIETCFAAIVDYESFPRWQDAVDSVEVLNRTDDGLGQDVRLFVDAKVKKIDYVLRYSYDRPTEIRWDFVEGNGMRDVDGVYTLEQLGSDRTRATYNLGADPELPVPGMILRRTHKQLVKRSVEDLKREAERRQAAGEAPEPTASLPGEGDADEAAPPEEQAPADEPAPAAASQASEGWAPKAEREAAARSEPRSGPDTGSARPSSASGGSATDLAGELVGKAVSTGRGIAEGAMRAGVGAAEQAVEVGRDVAGGLIRRVNRKLGDDRDERDERR